MFFEPISEAFRSGVATRKCPEPDDLEFVRLAVSRVLHETSSGRDFLQTHAIPQVPDLTRHSYFKNLGSSRRLKLIGDLKQSRSVHVLTDWKANFKPMSVIPRAVDRADPLNALVVSDETVYFANQPGVWRRITALKPDTGENHESLTNQMTLRPDTLNELRRMRWNIEPSGARGTALGSPQGASGGEHQKAFSEQECKLGEDKAWTADENGKRVQAIAICIACNLLRIFHDQIRREEGITDAKVEQAWKDKLVHRARELLALGREVPVKLYLSLRRPTEASLQFIRWLRIELLRASCYREALARLRPLMAKYL